ncbi:MAG TPA: tetratricopeptide repeat protein [Blastocatellia bacterium]|nr:tetratricopeptide repeat protein [Blastocatellia bacterium]
MLLALLNLPTQLRDPQPTAFLASRQVFRSIYGWVKAHRLKDEPQFWHALGYTLFNAGRWEEALKAFDGGAEVRPARKLSLCRGQS